MIRLGVYLIFLTTLGVSAFIAYAYVTGQDLPFLPQKSVPSIPQVQPVKHHGPDWLAYQGYEKTVVNDISVADRSEDAVADWIAVALPVLLTFDYKTYRDHLGQVKTYFNKPGIEDFINYLKKSDILNVMLKEGYYAKTFFEDNICVLENGVYQGVYSWLVEVPYTTSLYSSLQTEQSVVTARSNVRVLIQRADQGGGVDGLRIVRWTIKPRDVGFYYCLNG